MIDAKREVLGIQGPPLNGSKPVARVLASQACRSVVAMDERMAPALEVGVASAQITPDF